MPKTYVLKEECAYKNADSNEKSVWCAKNTVLTDRVNPGRDLQLGNRVNIQLTAFLCPLPRSNAPQLTGCATRLLCL